MNVLKLTLLNYASPYNFLLTILIQKKIEEPILNWTTDDYSLISLLTPWKKIFSNEYWTSFLNKYILPKLHAVTAKIVIDPINQKLTGLKNLFVWLEINW